MGDLGQIVPMVCIRSGCNTWITDARILRQEWDIRRPDQIAECLRHSDTVYNLVGREYETKYGFSTILTLLCYFRLTI